MTTKVNNFFKTKKIVWITSIIAVIAAVVLGVCIYNAQADDYVPGAGASWGGTSGGHSVAGQIIKRDLYYDEFNDDGEPKQGWGEDSIKYFYNGMYYAMGNRTFGRNSDGTSGYQKYVDVANRALTKARERAIANGADENVPARVVAVAWIYTIGSDNQAYLAHSWNLSGNESSASQMMPPPGTTGGAMIQGVNGVNYHDADWKTDGWNDQCDVPGYEHMTWYEYIYEKAIDDVDGVDHNTGQIIDERQWLGENLSLIVVAIAKDEFGGQAITVDKLIEGYDAANGSFEKNLYNATQGNSCYDLAGAEFTLYKSDENYSYSTDTVKSARIDSDGNKSSSPETIVYKIGDDGHSDAFVVKSGYYTLRETKAPDSGFYQDTDLDGVPDENDNSVGSGLRIKVKGSSIFINGSDDKLDVSDEYGNIKVFKVSVTDPPMYDPDAINLYKRDSVTGEVSVMPEGDASLNGAQYRLAYYKGVITKVSSLPGYVNDTEVDWTRANTTAIWTTHSYTDALTGKVWTGKISFAEDTPTSGSWLYKVGGKNVSPLGTIAIQEVSPPEGYKIDDRIYLISITDDGTHTTANLIHQPWQKSGLPGNDDWNNFANDYELNGDRDDIVTTFPQ